MSAVGSPWGPSQPPLEFVAKDGREATITVCEFGVIFSDGGGSSPLALCEEDPNDPNRLKFAGRWFRAEGA